MAKIRGIEYSIPDANGNEQWVQFGDSANDLAIRGYPQIPGHITGEQAYLMHIQEIGGPGSKPPTNYVNLSDMAIQMYETEAALYNDQLGRGE